MTTNQSFDSIESLESFCASVSCTLSSDGFAVSVQPGDHLVDDTGADSLTVLSYVSHLQSIGISIDLSAFDTRLLNIDFAYQTWLKIIAAQHQKGYAYETG
jgi:acyl carrier protein